MCAAAWIRDSHGGALYGRGIAATWVNVSAYKTHYSLSGETCVDYDIVVHRPFETIISRLRLASFWLSCPQPYF
jgi:phage tail sheath protein FI